MLLTSQWKGLSMLHTGFSNLGLLTASATLDSEAAIAISLPMYFLDQKLTQRNGR